MTKAAANCLTLTEYEVFLYLNIFLFHFFPCSYTRNLYAREH